MVSGTRSRSNQRAGGRGGRGGRSATRRAPAISNVDTTERADDTVLPPPPASPTPTPAKSELTTLFLSFGIDAPSVDELQKQQFETTEDFVDYDPDDFKELFKIFTKSDFSINQKQRKKIMLLHAWVQNMVKLDMEYEAFYFNTREMVATRDRMALLKTTAESNKTDELEPPKKFAGFHDWEAFDNSLKHHLTRRAGIATCPLTYIIRDDADPKDKYRDTKYYHSPSDSDEYYTQCVVYTGLWYKIDNSKVWSTLKTACIDTPGWEYIKTSEKKKDGRSAYLKLQLSALSTNSRATRVNAALALTELVWTGPKQHFTFNDFNAQYVKAYSDLAILGATKIDIEKIKVYLGNIQDPRCDTAKAFVAGSTLLCENFDECSAYVTKVITSQKLHKLDGGGGKKSRVASVEKKPTAKKHANASEGTYKGTIENIPYNSDIYKTFSKAQRKELSMLRRQGYERDSRQHQIAAVDQQEINSPATPVTPTINTGGQFGSAGSKRKANGQFGPGK